MQPRLDQPQPRRANLARGQSRAASSAHVDQGVELVISAGAALNRIFSQVTEIDRVVSAIASGAGEQASGPQSVNTGVSDIDRATQRNTAMAEKTTSASESLTARAEDLVRSIGRFQIGRTAARATPAPASVEGPRRRRA